MFTGSYKLDINTYKSPALQTLTNVSCTYTEVLQDRVSFMGQAVPLQELCSMTFGVLYWVEFPHVAHALHALHV